MFDLQPQIRNYPQQNALFVLTIALAEITDAQNLYFNMKHQPTNPTAKPFCSQNGVCPCCFIPNYFTKNV